MRSQTQFTYDGFTFRLIQRAGDIVLFSKSKPTHPRETFEVVVLQQHPARVIFGKAYPARESFPPPESWGSAGWSLTSIDRAKEKFRQVLESQRKGPFHPYVRPPTSFPPEAKDN
jgi:hypothetical protein